MNTTTQLPLSPGNGYGNTPSPLLAITLQPLIQAVSPLASVSIQEFLRTLGLQDELDGASVQSGTLHTDQAPAPMVRVPPYHLHKPYEARAVAFIF